MPVEPEKFILKWRTVGGLSEDSFDSPWVRLPGGEVVSAEELIPIASDIRKALWEVLDGLNALSGRWWELTDYGIPEERAKEIVALFKEQHWQCYRCRERFYTVKPGDGVCQTCINMAAL